jgi:hypothetical protein
LETTITLLGQRIPEANYLKAQIVVSVVHSVFR